MFEQEVVGIMQGLPDWESLDGSTRKYRVSTDTKRARAEYQLEESRKALHVLETNYAEAKSFVEAMSLIRENLKGTRDDLLFSMTTIRSQMLTGEVAIQPSIDLTKKVEKALLGDTQDRVKSIMSGEVEL